MRKYLFIVPLLAAACNSGESFTSREVIEPFAAIVEYTPAPGQFINEPASGFEGVATPAQACAYAERRLRAGSYVSLGGWGGYLIASFESSVEPLADGSEIYVMGNPLASSSEPGVVWVARDQNANGRPDDVWYELRGSEFGQQVQGYSVTYAKPQTDNQPVAWSDSEGQTGHIERMPEHTQPSYFPAWLSGSEQTYTGVRLPDNVGKTDVEGTPSWTPAAFAWGYADNYSKIDMFRGYNRFSISNAVDAAGRSVMLPSVDFVMIQTGVNASAPLIGEISTEVCGIACRRVITKE